MTKELKEKLDKIEDMNELDSELKRLLNEDNTLEKSLSKYINKVNKYNKKLDKARELKKIELDYLNTYDYVFGIDEVGRGPLAGPVCAACCMMKKESEILDVDDSKKLTEETREKLFDIIKSESVKYAVALESAETIDERNILDATFLAMSKAFNECVKDIPKDKKILVIIDGNLKNKYIDNEQISIVKGDSKVYSISCASIIAKVTRDRIMNELDSKYPEYDFINNKGYGTEKHRKALKEIGPVEGLHRKTFIKNLI
ncbi:MAG: ribonuclease HII [Clostridia bacterium]|nr:ribonuclease HII [Clostridia bacterium]